MTYENQNETTNEAKLQKQINVKEALKFACQKNWTKKLGSILLLYAIPTILYMEITSYYINSEIVNPTFFIISSIIFLLYALSSITVYGYFSLSAHDRALDKNAELRNILTCIPEAFSTGIKNTVLGATITLTLLAVFIIPFLISLIFFAINVPIIGGLLIIISIVAIITLSILMYFKIWPYFIKDLSYKSIFQWKEAFAFCKNMHFGKMNLFIIFLCAYAVNMIVAITSGLLYIISEVIILLGGSYAFEYVVINPVSGILIIIAQWFGGLFMASAFGQYTYNAIEEKMNVQPETLPKEINNNKIATIIIAIFMTIMAVFGITLQMIAQKLKYDQQTSLNPSVQISKIIEK